VEIAHDAAGGDQIQAPCSAGNAQRFLKTWLHGEELGMGEFSFVPIDVLA